MGFKPIIFVIQEGKKISWWGWKFFNCI